jgi:hypothetical protein
LCVPALLNVTEVLPTLTGVAGCRLVPPSKNSIVPAPTVLGEHEGQLTVAVSDTGVPTRIEPPGAAKLTAVGETTVILIALEVIAA